MIAPLLDEGLDEAKDDSFGKKSQQGMRFQREACTGMKQSTGRKHLTGFVQ